MRKWPLALIAGLLFIGAFKSSPAQGISLTDPTMVIFLLAAGAIFIELLFIVSGSSDFHLHELFAGQALGIILFVSFAAVLALSYLYTPAKGYGAGKLLHFTAFQSVVFFAPLIFLRREKDLEQLLFAFFLLGLALAFKEIYGFLHPSKEVLSGNRDITHIGNAQLIGMSLLIFFYAQPFRRFPKVLAVPVLGIGLVACAARGPLLSMLVVMVVYSLAVHKGTGFVSYKHLIVGLGIVAVVVVCALSWVEKYPSAQAKIAEKKQELKAFVGGSKDPGGTLEQRLDYYQSALSAFSKEPLTGLGLGGWTVYYHGFEKPDYPHNIVLEVASEQGIVGLTLLFCFFGAVWTASRQIWKYRPELAFAIPLYVYSVLVGMFSGDINIRALWFWSGTIFAISRMCALHATQRLSSSPVLQPA
jgi:O-antigen ligase